MFGYTVGGADHYKQWEDGNFRRVEEENKNDSYLLLSLIK